MRRRRPVPRVHVPPFAQVGRPVPGRSDLWSRPLILAIAVGIFTAFLGLLWELQQHQARQPIVEVTFMEEEAARAEAALDQSGRRRSEPAAAAPAAAPAAPPHLESTPLPPAPRDQPAKP